LQIKTGDWRFDIGAKKKRLVSRSRVNSTANIQLLEYIKAIKGDHPFWGYRRISAYLRRKTGQKVNHKRVYRLMLQNNLLVPKNQRLLAPRKATTTKPKTKEPNRYWGIDMTKIMIPSYGWVYVHVVLDWGSKKLLSSRMSLSSKASDWIDALNDAVNMQYPDGIQGSKRPCLVSDHGSQPTAKLFRNFCSILEIEQIFASYCNPKGNADTERVIRTLKEDLIWSREFNNIQDFETALNQWQKDYNEDFPHSTLGYMTPYEYERWFNASVA
jgi:transposase InsO family protein